MQPNVHSLDLMIYQVCVHVCVCCGSSLHNKMEILEIALWVILVWILRYKLALLCYFSMHMVVGIKKSTLVG